MAVQICKGEDRQLQEPLERIVGHSEDQEEQDPQEELFPISCRNRGKEESHQLENLVAGGQAGLTSAPKEKRKGEDVGGKKSFNQWTLRLTLLKMLRYLKGK